MSAAQASLFDSTPEQPSRSTWRDYESDPVPHIRHLPVVEQIKRCRARFVHQHRFERCPYTEDIGDEHREITWSEWFQIHHGQTLTEYELEIKQSAAVAASTANEGVDES